MSIIYSISISEKKHTLKEAVEEAVVNELGIVGDGHAGPGNRQITLMDFKDFIKIQQDNNLVLKPGDMAENVIVRGMDFSACRPRTKISLGSDILVEVMQIGKEDHPSVVTRKFGVSILPYKGLFCRVIHGGAMKVGDQAEIIKD